MKVLNAGIGVLFVCLSSIGWSQAIDEAVILAEIELARAIASEQVESVVADSMKLNPQEAEGFWPVYQAYRDDMQQIDDRLLDLIAEYANYYNSDGKVEIQASSLTNKHFGVEKDRISLKQRYLRKFKKVLPDEKVMLFYQIDNRIRSLVNLGLIQQIPLVIE